MKKNKRIIIGERIAITVVIIVILIFIINRIFNLIKNPTDTFLVEKGKLSQEDTIQGYVIRDEVVIKGENYKNGMEKIKSEGEKIAKGEAVFRYYTKGEDTLIEKIKELDIKIEETMEKENTNILLPDVKALETQIEEKINELYKMNDVQKIKEYKTDINNLLTKKAKITGDKSPAGSYLKELIEERSKYENELNSGSEYLIADRSGVVSYRVDGLEEVLTTQNFGTLSKKTLEGLNLKTGQIVSTSEESGKIINNFECYIACILKNEKLENVQVGNTLKVRLSNNEEINAQVEYISNESETESLIVFKIEKYVEELINYRKISFDIIWWSATGLKVPNDAIKIENENLSYIVRERNGYTDKIYVKILKQNENYSIIENYTRAELVELGLPQEELTNRSTISIYDEVQL